MSANSKKFDIAEKISVMEATPVASKSNDVESIVKNCLEKGNFKLFKNLSVKTVSSTSTVDGDDIRTRCTFIVNTPIWGMITSKDAFGMEKSIPGMTDIFTVSTFSLAGAMRGNGDECALLARDISNMKATITDDGLKKEYPLSSKENIADIIFTGGSIDVLAEYVPAGEVISSPFSTTNADREPLKSDKIIHYIVGCKLGKYGIKKLEKLI